MVYFKGLSSHLAEEVKELNMYYHCRTEFKYEKFEIYETTTNCF
jgi:hypothetical protein